MFFVIISTSASATSWVYLQPEEILERAEVIVLGSYDFSSEPKSAFIFQGYEFHVRELFLGDYSEPLIAGIDYNNVGWATKFQKDGGEFLLLLEENESVDFLVPVAGINGLLDYSN